MSWAVGLGKLVGTPTKEDDWYRHSSSLGLQRARQRFLRRLTLGIQSCPPCVGFFLWFQLPQVNHPPEAADPLSDVESEGQQQPDAMSPWLRHSLTSISSRSHFISSYHHKKGEYRTIRSFERKRDHIYITFMTVYCYNCSISLSVIAVNLLPCPSDKLHFIVGMYVQENTECTKGSVRPRVSGIHWGPWDVSPMDKEGLLYKQWVYCVQGTALIPLSSRQWDSRYINRSFTHHACDWSSKRHVRRISQDLGEGVGYVSIKGKDSFSLPSGVSTPILFPPHNKTWLLYGADAEWQAFCTSKHIRFC